MKNYNIKSLFLILVVTTTMILTGCKKDLQPSKATFLPEISLIGASAVSVDLDGVFADPGAEATVNGSPIDYETFGTINFSSSGVYTLTYTATNEDGFSSSVTRDVLVLPGAVTNDVNYIVGDYQTIIATDPAYKFSSIKKIGPGAYYTTNCWGNGSKAVLPAYFFCLDGVTLTIPKQGDGGAQVETQNDPGVYDPSNNSIVWEITRPLFSTGSLTATKNWSKI